MIIHKVPLSSIPERVHPFAQTACGPGDTGLANIPHSKESSLVILPVRPSGNCMVYKLESVCARNLRILLGTVQSQFE